MIERFPDGTPEIPYPHTTIRWSDGAVSLTVRVEPGGMLSAPPAPKIDGFACHFVAHHGRSHTEYTYRPTPPPARPEWRRKVRSDSPVLYAIGRCIEDRESLDEPQLDSMWQQLAEDPDLAWSNYVGPTIDAIEDMAASAVSA